jgi:hypothetical protein
MRHDRVGQLVMGGGFTPCEGVLASVLRAHVGGTGTWCVLTGAFSCF